MLNKADIRDQSTLDTFEADATAVRLLELTESPIQGNFDLVHLQAIHQHLFQDVYDWAGELRKVDISKGASRFANVNMIATYLGGQLNKLRFERFLRDLAPDLFISRLAFYMRQKLDFPPTQGTTGYGVSRL